MLSFLPLIVVALIAVVFILIISRKSTESSGMEHDPTYFSSAHDHTDHSTYQHHHTGHSHHSSHETTTDYSSGSDSTFSDDYSSGSDFSSGSDSTSVD